MSGFMPKANNVTLWMVRQLELFISINKFRECARQCVKPFHIFLEEFFPIQTQECIYTNNAHIFCAFKGSLPGIEPLFLMLIAPQVLRFLCKSFITVVGLPVN